MDAMVKDLNIAGERGLLLTAMQPRPGTPLEQQGQPLLRTLGAGANAAAEHGMPPF